jgi:glycosyltransferase involved in cell wall biosynthesis
VASATWESTAPAASIVISTYERPEYLPGLFAHLERQDLERDRFEVVIVDDGSGETAWETLKACAAASPLAVRAFRATPNSGAATGRNTAVSHARGDVLLFTDDDCLPEPAWARELVASLRDGVHIVQGRTEPERGVPRGPWDRTLAILQTSDLFETCNIAYRRSDIVAVGGFAAMRRGAGALGPREPGEDTLLGWKVARATGAAVTFAPDAVVEHRIEPRSYRDWLRIRTRTGIFNAVVANVPEFRKRLFLRVFFSTRTAAFDAAVLGLVVAAILRTPFALLLAVPYLVSVRPRERRLLGWARRLGLFVLGDAATAYGLVRGSLRHRRVVL